MLEEIDLSNCIYVSDRGILSIARECSNVKKADLSECTSLHGSAILEFASMCTLLQDFAIPRCPVEVNATIDQRVLYSLASVVERIYLSYC